MVLSLRARQSTVGQTTTESVSAGQPTHTTLQFRLLGAAKNPAILGEEPQLGRVNYFLGNDPANWHTNVPTFAHIRYKNIYPGIDLVYYGNHRQLEYDFAVAPGADPGRIQFEIMGATRIHIDAQGNLVLEIGAGELHFQSPMVYQESTGRRVAVAGGYVVDDATHVGFHVAAYDRSKPLVIDPVLIYSTYLGGSGDEQPAGVAVDSAGNTYLAGSTNSADFPLSTLGSLPAGVPHVFSRSSMRPVPISCTRIISAAIMRTTGTHLRWMPRMMFTLPVTRHRVIFRWSIRFKEHTRVDLTPF